MNKITLFFGLFMVLGCSTSVDDPSDGMNLTSSDVRSGMQAGTPGGPDPSADVVAGSVDSLESSQLPGGQLVPPDDGMHQVISGGLMTSGTQTPIDGLAGVDESTGGRASNVTSSNMAGQMNAGSDSVPGGHFASSGYLAADETDAQGSGDTGTHHRGGSALEPEGMHGGNLNIGGDLRANSAIEDQLDDQSLSSGDGGDVGGNSSEFNFGGEESIAGGSEHFITLGGRGDSPPNPYTDGGTSGFETGGSQPLVGGHPLGGGDNAAAGKNADSGEMAHLQPSCDDAVQNGDEIGIDCGGGCEEGCPDGVLCHNDDHCESGRCEDPDSDGTGLCTSCLDGQQNGLETGVDCGGTCPNACPLGSDCRISSDCASGRCDPLEDVGSGRCGSCADGQPNGGETDVDCGGPCLQGCRNGRDCAADADCISGHCDIIGNASIGRCGACNDQIQNGDETGVDCGGRCTTGCIDGSACMAAGDCLSGRCEGASEFALGQCSSCFDDVVNGDELAADCGGACSQGCPLGTICFVPSDCESQRCDIMVGAVDGLCGSCADGVQNGDESDVDCGGPCPQACLSGALCEADDDCETGYCFGNEVPGEGRCASCDNGLRDGDESDVDCGGACIQKCGLNESCRQGPDCLSGLCAGLTDTRLGQCFDCDNEVQDGDETGPDCGGQCADKCPDGSACALDADCISGGCDRSVTEALGLCTSCTDDLQNGNEAGIDCGGRCGANCPDGIECGHAGDCASARCATTQLGTVCASCFDGVSDETEADVDCGGTCEALCSDGERCGDGNHCKSGRCSIDNRCVSCSDGLSDQAEADVDCGGVCPVACVDGLDCQAASDCLSGRCAVDGGGLGTCVSCEDGVVDADEADIDCGGLCPETCADGKSCIAAEDCASGRCADLEGIGLRCVSCNDGLRDDAETDADCGGVCPSTCVDGKRCLDDVDCASGRCAGAGAHAQTCISCSDGKPDEAEADIDCGGVCPNRCPDGRNCTVAADCSSGRCGDSGAGVSSCVSCSDGIRDDGEGDVDCGGVCPTSCADGLRCFVDADCESERCDRFDGVHSGTCTSCFDGTQNGDETGVDCGGSCETCACAYATPLGIGTHEGQFGGGTGEHDASCASSGFGRDAAHRLAFDFEGPVCATIETVRGDTVLYLRDECGPREERATRDADLVCNDSKNYPDDRTSQIQIDAVPGTEYYLFVDQYSGHFADAELELDEYTIELKAGPCRETACRTEALWFDGWKDCPTDFQCHAIGESAPCPESIVAEPWETDQCDGRCAPIVNQCDEDSDCDGFTPRCVNGRCKARSPQGSCLSHNLRRISVGQSLQANTLDGFATHSGQTTNSDCGASGLNKELVFAIDQVDVDQNVCIRVESSDFEPLLYVRQGHCSKQTNWPCGQSVAGETSEQEVQTRLFSGDHIYVFVDALDDAVPVGGQFNVHVLEGSCPECLRSSQCEPGLVCRDSICTPGAQQGDVLIVEASHGLGNGQTWLELAHNPPPWANADSAAVLDGCQWTVGSNTGFFGPLRVASSGRVLLMPEGHSPPPGAPMGVDIHHLPINIEGGETRIAIECNGQLVDDVNLDLSPNQDGTAIHYSLMRLSKLNDLVDEDVSELNDNEAAWCRLVAPSPALENGQCLRCIDHPCPAAPAPRCDGESIITRIVTCSESTDSDLERRCTEVESANVCIAGQACVDATCVNAPQVGDLLISELMVAPHPSVAREGEWVEIQNRRTDALFLSGCTLRDTRFELSIPDTIVAPGAYLLFGASAAYGQLQGIEYDGILPFRLNDAGDVITLICRGVIIDSMSYGEVPLVSQGRSLTLGGQHLDAISNDEASAWCAGINAFGDENYGTPGTANRLCDGCLPDPCGGAIPEPSCDGADRRVTHPEGYHCQTDEDGQVKCILTSQVDECDVGSTCRDGICLVETHCAIIGCDLGKICSNQDGNCVPAPAAGTCTVPTEIRWAVGDDLTFHGSTDGAANVHSDASCGDGGTGPEAVYELIFESSGQVCVSTELSDPTFDTILHVRGLCDVSDSELIEPSGCLDDIGDNDGDGACDDLAGFCSSKSELHLYGEVGESVFIIVDGAQSDTGNYTLTVNDGPCANGLLTQCHPDVPDDCDVNEICQHGLCQPVDDESACQAPRVVDLVLDDDVSHTGTTRFSTTGMSPRGCDGGATATKASPEIVHSFTAQRSGLVCASTRGSTFDTVLYVREVECIDGNQKACNDDLGFNLFSQVEFAAGQGKTYYLVVDGHEQAEPDYGEYTLTLSEGACSTLPAPCSEDGTCPGSCTQPEPITSFGEYVGSSRGAPVAESPQTCGQDLVGPEVVYEVNLDYEGKICASTVGTRMDYDTLIYALNQCEVPRSELSCSDSYAGGHPHGELELEIQIGESPIIVVDSISGEGGEFTLAVSQGPCPDCHRDEDCAFGRRCHQGDCIECVGNDDCREGYICDGRLCRNAPCESDLDCPLGTMICGDAALCIVGSRNSCDDDALVLLTDPQSYSGTTATGRSSHDHTCDVSQVSPEVVHQVHFTADRFVCVRSASAEFTPVLAIRQGVCLDEGDETHCAKAFESGGGQSAGVTLSAKANTHYYIFVDGADQSGGVAEAGAYTLTFENGPCAQCEEDGQCNDGFCQDQLCVECVEDSHCDVEDVCAGNVCRRICSADDTACPIPIAADFYGRLEQSCDVNAGYCVDPGGCAEPRPMSIGQSYSGASDEQNSSIYLGFCRDNSGEVFWGQGSEVVYTFIAPADGPACFRLTEATFDAVLYLKTECATRPNVQSRQGFLSSDACVDAQDSGGPDELESMEIDLLAGQRYFFFVDASTAGSNGQFTFDAQYGACP